MYIPNERNSLKGSALEKRSEGFKSCPLPERLRICLLNELSKTFI